MPRDGKNCGEKRGEMVSKTVKKMHDKRGATKAFIHAK